MRTTTLFLSFLLLALSALTGCGNAPVVEMSPEEERDIQSTFEVECRQEGYSLLNQLITPRLTQSERLLNIWLRENMGQDDQNYRILFWNQVMNRMPAYDLKVEKGDNPPMTDYQVWQREFDHLEYLHEALAQAQAAYDREDFPVLVQKNQNCRAQVAQVQAYLNERDGK